MSRILLLVVVLSVSACANTQPAQDTAEMASKQLLRLETELQSAAKTLYSKYERQQEFVEQAESAAREAESYKEQLIREWEVSGNKEASRLYAAVLSTRPKESKQSSTVNARKLAVNTAPIKKAIKDLGAINELLADQNTAEAFLRFGYKVQEKYEDLAEAEKD